MPDTEPLPERFRQALKEAARVVERTDNWLAAHNALFGVGAIYGKLFPTREDRDAFIASDEYGQVSALLSTRTLVPGDTD